MYNLIGLLAKLASAYSLLCFVKIILSWIPSLSNSKVSEILGKICDPYLNLFRKIPLQFANIDFSPIIALIVLSGISSILQTIAVLEKISLGVILAIIIQMVWAAISSILLLLIILLAVRLVVLLLNKDSIGFWSSVDSLSYKIARYVIKIFFKIKLPLILPSFISAALTSLGFAWKSGIAAEVIAKPLNSLGNMLEKSKTHLEIAEVFALTVVVALLSLLLEVSLKKIFRRYRDVKA